MHGTILKSGRLQPVDMSEADLFRKTRESTQRNHGARVRACVFVLTAIMAGFVGHSSVLAATIDWNPPVSGSGGSTAWATGTNWTGNTAPTNDLITDVARFDQASYNFSPDAGTTSISGIVIGDGTTAATLTLAGTNLTIGANGITKLANSQTAGITSAITLGAAQSWVNNSAVVLGINGNITGSSDITINGVSGSVISLNPTTNSGFTGNFSVIGGSLNINNTPATSAANIVSVGLNGTLTSNTAAVTPTIAGLNDISGAGGTVAIASSRSLTMAGSGSYSFSGNITSGGLVINLTGGGSQTLTGVNTYAGSTTVNSGILNIQSDSALGTTAGGTSVGSGGTLQLQGGIHVGAEALTISGVGSAGQNGALVNVSGNNTYAGLLAWTSGATATIISSDAGNLALTNSGTIAISGGRNGVLTGSGNGSIAGGLSGTGSGLIKNGTGTWTLTGNNTYTGATAVNAGTLTLAGGGSLGATGVTVSAAASTGLNIGGTYTIGTATGGSLTVTGGASGSQGTLSLVDGTPNTLTLANNSAADVFTIGSTTASQNSIINMEVGATSDQIVVGTGTSAIYIKYNNTKTSVNISGLGSLSGTQQTLISAPGGVGTTSGTRVSFANGFQLGTTSGNFGGYTVALGNDATHLYLTESANAAPANAYYNGGAAAVSGQGGTTAFNSFVNGNTNTSNFGTGSGGSGNASGLVAGTTNVTFDTNILSPLSTALGQDLEVNSLAFKTGSAVTIGGSNTLTINATSANGNTLGNGITVAAGAGNNAISSKVALANDQTWTVTDAATILTVSNEISGAGKALTKAGAGTLALSGANTYTGTTLVSVGTLLINGGQTSATGTVTVSNAATLGGSGTTGGAVLISSGGVLSPGNNAIGNLTAASLTLSSGAISNFEIGDTTVGTFDTITTTGGNGSITLNGTLNLIFSVSLANNSPLHLFIGPSSNIGDFTAITLTGSGYSGTFTSHVGTLWTSSQGAQTLSFDASTGVLAATPEPATWGLLGFSLTAVLIFRRRHRV